MEDTLRADYIVDPDPRAWEKLIATGTVDQTTRGDTHAR